MIYNAEYKPYIIRSLNGFRPIIFIGFFAMILVGLLNGEAGIKISILIGAAFLLVVFVFSLIENRTYLKSIEIVEETKNITLIIYKYNRFQKRVEFKLSDLKIEIQETVIVYESYYLKITERESGKRVFKQASVGGWNTKLFVDVIKELDKINSTTTDVSYIKGAYKYGLYF
ncbi:MAG: hypothetical protein RBT35_08815 [Bacteroidales bacterium]|jgi:hypothetical protein|nr:hypothetical protein [Bacteroidales bacterium]